MKKLFLFLILIVLIQPGYTQQLAPTVIASAGKDLVAGEYRLSFTIGELAVTTLRSGSYILTQGFQQPPNLYLSGISENPEDNFVINAYPNPTTDFIHLSISNFLNFNDLRIYVYDILGKLVSVPYEVLPADGGSNVTIDLNSLSRGNYFIRVLKVSDAEFVAEFKVIKIN